MVFDGGVVVLLTTRKYNRPFSGNGLFWEIVKSMIHRCTCHNVLFHKKPVVLSNGVNLHCVTAIVFSPKNVMFLLYEGGRGCQTPVFALRTY